MDGMVVDVMVNQCSKISKRKMQLPSQIQSTNLCLLFSSFVRQPPLLIGPIVVAS
jgi:hypothetical protein